MEQNYTPNSHRYKEEQKQKENEKRAQKVVKGNVIRKKNKSRTFMNEIISDDARNVKSYVFGEVLIPAIKKALADIVTDGINIILYGESRGRSGRSTVDRVSYSSYSKDNRYSRDTRAGLGSGYSYDDITLETRGEAQEVLDTMDEIMDSYGLVRVTDFYDLVGVTGSYTDNKYGWTNIASAEIVRVSDGYKIKLPRARVLD